MHTETETPTFQERYERREQIGSEHFVEHLLRRTLYAHARVLRPLLPKDTFMADRVFLAGVGRERSRRGVVGECNDFLADLGQEPIWKRKLYLRVSTNRVREIASSIW